MGLQSRPPAHELWKIHARMQASEASPAKRSEPVWTAIHRRHAKIWAQYMLNSHRRHARICT